MTAALIPAGRCRLLIAAACALAALAGAIALVPAAILYAIAEALVNRVADPLGLTILQYVFAAIASVIARLALLVFARVAAGTATVMLTRAIRARAAEKIGTLPLGILEETPPGAFETTLLDDVATIGESVSERLVDAVGAYAMLAVALLILLARDWRLALAGTALVVLAALWFRARGAALRRDPAPERTARERLGGAVFAAVRSAAFERSLPPGDAAHPVAVLAARYGDATRDRLARASAARAERRAFAGLVPAAFVVTGLWFAGDAARVPALVLFAAVAIRVSGALVAAFAAPASFAPARASAARIRALLALPSMTSGAAEPTGAPGLRFTNVSFAYAGAADPRPILRDVSFSVAPGAVTALVGPSGCGKTTLTRLAARFWDVDGGTVAFADVDVRDIPLDALMRRIGFVFQDAALLDDTIAANLRLARADASDDEVVRAATAAAAHDFIAALPDGYETRVGDRGLRLSRGERQRLQIARAFLKDAPVLILDEPTASLDPATEAHVFDALAAFARGRTVLVVTHRLATIVDADRVVLLDANGSVAAEGTHADLLARSALYATLWNDDRATLAATVPAEGTALT